MRNNQKTSPFTQNIQGWHIISEWEVIAECQSVFKAEHSDPVRWRRFVQPKLLCWTNDSLLNTILKWTELKWKHFSPLDGAYSANLCQFYSMLLCFHRVQDKCVAKVPGKLSDSRTSYEASFMLALYKICVC